MNAPDGPSWNDPELDALAEGLRLAHAQVKTLPGAATSQVRVQITRRLLVITDLAKRDASLALRRLESFLNDLEQRRKRAPNGSSTCDTAENLGHG